MKKFLLGIFAFLAVSNVANAETVLSEDFSWVNHGSILGWDTTGETRITNWTEDDLAHGWTSFGKRVYARTGFVKIGATGYAGDLVSPALSSLTATTNVKVSFDAVGYTSSSGTYDANALRVGVIGAGNVKADKVIADFAYITADSTDTTIQVADFTMDKSEKGYFLKSADDTGLLIWNSDAIHFSFTIEGADASTRLVFLGPDFTLTKTSVKNRIFFDNILVETIEASAVDAVLANSVKFDKAANAIVAGEPADITVYNINGVVVASAKNAASLDVEGLANGIYIAKVADAVLKFAK